MKIGIVTNSPPWTGIGRYAATIYSHLRDTCLYDFSNIYLDWNNRSIIDVKDEPNVAPNGDRSIHLPGIKYLWYASVRSKIPQCDLYHLTNQNLSFLKLPNNVDSSLKAGIIAMIFCWVIQHCSDIQDRNYGFSSSN